MPTVFFITHPDVAIDPGVSVADWPLNKRGRARMHAITTRPWVRRVRHIFASSERKARDAAQILADGLGLGGYSVIANLAENDRKTTERRRASLPRTSSRGPSTRSLRSRNRASGAGSRPRMLRHELLSPSSRPCRKPLSERISPLSGTAARGPCSIAASRGCRSIAATISPRRMVATGLPSTGRAENCYATAGSRSTQGKPPEPARSISSPTIPALVTAAGDRASMRFPEFSANKSAIRTRAGPTPRLHRNFGMLVCRRSPPSSRKCRD